MAVHPSLFFFKCWISAITLCQFHFSYWRINKKIRSRFKIRYKCLFIMYGQDWLRFTSLSGGRGRRTKRLSILDPKLRRWSPVNTDKEMKRVFGDSGTSVSHSRVLHFFRDLKCLYTMNVLQDCILGNDTCVAYGGKRHALPYKEIRLYCPNIQTWNQSCRLRGGYQYTK
jgi:hypothetical protein